MSGGAGGEVIGRGLVALAKFRVGRIVLWMLASLCVLIGLASSPINGDRRAWMAISVVFAFTAAAGAWVARRKRGFGSQWLLFKLALGGVALGVTALLLWLQRRQRTPEAVLLPPQPEEVDRLALAELDGGRAA